MRFAASLLLITALPIAAPVAAQGTPDNPQIEQQVEAMARLAMLDGTWRGPATTMTREGPKALTQTERVGPMLGGTIRVIEGRGYDEAGHSGFNAFAVVSYDPVSGQYEMQSWAQGRNGSFPMTVTDTGFEWSIPAGPGAQVHYTAMITADTWHETGEYRREGQPARAIFDMTLTRTGDSDWPMSGAVPLD